MRIPISIVFAAALAGSSTIALADASDIEVDDNKDNSTQRIVNPEHTPTNEVDSDQVKNEPNIKDDRSMQNESDTPRRQPETNRSR